MANSLGDMVVRIVGDTAGVNKSLDETQKKMIAAGVNAAAMGAAILLATKAVAKAVGNFADYGSAIYDASQKTGLSTKAIQEWKFIAEQSGTTLETVTSSVALMTKGLKTNAELFKHLGIETKNTNGTFRTTTEIFNDTIKKLSSMQDATERDQLAFKLLGRGAQEMIPILNAGGGALDDMRKEAHDLGIVLSDEVITSADKLGDNIDALKSSFQATGNELISALAPALISLSNGLKTLITEWNDLDKGSKTFLITLTGLAIGILPLVMGFINLGKAITGVKATLELLQTSKALAKAVSGGWVTLAIAGVVALGVAFIGLTKSAEESRKKLAEIERLKIGGSSTDLQASIKLLNSEYDKQRKILDSLLSVDLRRYTDGKIRAEKEKEIQIQKDAVQILADTIKKQLLQVDTLRLKEIAAQKSSAAQSGMITTFTELTDAQFAGNEAVLESTKFVYDEKLNFAAESANQLMSLEEWEVENTKTANELKAASYREFFDNVNTVGKAVFEQLGQDIVDGTISWNNLATAAVNAIGNIVSALGDQMAAKAAAAFIDAIILGLLGAGGLAAQSAGAGVAYSAAAAAAWTVGGALKAKKFADGGIVQPQRGGVQAIVAEAGQSEAIIPLDRLDSMLSKAGNIGGDGGMMSLVVNLDSRPLLDKIFEATRNQTVLISAGAIV